MALSTLWRQRCVEDFAQGLLNLCYQRRLNEIVESTPSHFDQADLPPLRQMALETGGLFTLLNRPGDLIPVMLDALELALRSQQLPIRDQQINIDPDIRQLRVIRLGSESDIELKTDSRVVNSTSENTGVVYYRYGISDVNLVKSLHLVVTR